VASAILLWLGIKRDWTKPDANAGNQYADIDA
jgi:preprotein translocase subunit SecF